MVIQAVEMAVREVPKDKLMLGISLPSENAESLAKRIGIAKRYGLDGMALWRLGLVGDQQWQVIREAILPRSYWVKEPVYRRLLEAVTQSHNIYRLFLLYRSTNVPVFTIGGSKMDYVFTTGGKELLPQIRPLWNELKKHHVEVAGVFSPVFARADWESRRADLECKALMISLGLTS